MTWPDGRTVRIDPHLHTAASYDGRTTPEQLLDAARRAGLDGVAVTDHDTLRGARIASSLAAERDLLTITGCEVSTADGHLLALGIDSRPEPGRPLAETARVVRDAGGLAVVPHPFQRSRHGASRDAIRAVDGIEVYNAQTLTGLRNQQARRFATEAGYASFAGSDAHRPEAVGLAATDVHLPPGSTATVRAVVESMRDGRTSITGRRTSPWQYVTKVVSSAKRRAASFR